MARNFRRQVPIETYIADFVCHAAKLVIELDGRAAFFQMAKRQRTQNAAPLSKREAFAFCASAITTLMANRAGRALNNNCRCRCGERAPTLTLPRKAGEGEKETARWETKSHEIHACPG